MNARMEKLNRVPFLLWFQRSPSNPSMTAQVDFVNGMYRYQVHDASTYSPYVPIVEGWSQNMVEAMNCVQDYFEEEQCR